MRARDRLEEGRVVERAQRAQVDHLGLDAFAGEHLRASSAFHRLPP